MIFQLRDKHKTDKHMPGCIELLRGYLTVVFTTLGGIGPSAAREYFYSFYRPSYTAELLAGGTGTDSARRRQNLTFCLQASLARSNCTMVTQLVTRSKAAAAAAAHAPAPPPAAAAGAAPPPQP